MSHTPGPWKVEYDGASLPIITATINGRWDFLAMVRHARGDETANAHLIAAAPDLLEALKGMERQYVELVESGDCGYWDVGEEVAIKAARAAIAKAEGK